LHVFIKCVQIYGKIVLIWLYNRSGDDCASLSCYSSWIFDASRRVSLPWLSRKLDYRVLAARQASCVQELILIVLRYLKGIRVVSSSCDIANISTYLIFNFLWSWNET